MSTAVCPHLDTIEFADGGGFNTAPARNVGPPIARATRARGVW
jgi:hypothetical protein